MLLVVGLLQTNCYVIVDDNTRAGVVLDPGGDAKRILDATSDLCIHYVINTHAHFDHVVANREVLTALRDRQDTIPQLVVHSEAGPLLAMDGGASWFGFAPIKSPKPDRFVDHGDTLCMGQLSLQVLHTPGHSTGSVSFYCPSERALFVGDTLFRQGVGRADLPGGDWNTLLDTIRDQLFAFPEDTAVYPGHGPSTTIGDEKRHNPYVN